MAVPNRKDVAVRLGAAYKFDGTRDNAREFCRQLAKELRKTDKRWGLNWKRGKVGDQSADIVAYQDGAQVRIVDVIAAYDNPAEWPTPKGPQILWHLHSIEAAGKVAWFWTEREEPEPPPSTDPPPPVDDSAILRQIEARVSSLEARLDRLKAAL